MQVLRILVAVVFLSCATLSLAQQPDQKVSKAISDSCQRDETQQNAEIQMLNVANENLR